MRIEEGISIIVENIFMLYIYALAYQKSKQKQIITRLKSPPQAENFMDSRSLWSIFLKEIEHFRAPILQIFRLRRALPPHLARKWRGNFLISPPGSQIMGEITSISPLGPG